MADQASLVAVDIGHDFGDGAVLADINVTVSQGEWVALTGPSGSGKTTLLSILGGMLRPSSGFTHVASAAGDVTPVRSTVAWVLQTTTALGRRTVLDNAALGGLSDGLSAETAANRASQVLDRLGLLNRAGYRARELSGGELQRLAIARALTSTRPFLLADEPTGQIDRSTSRQVLEAMKRACADVGVMIATHDMDVARECDRVLTLSDGRIHAVET